MTRFAKAITSVDDAQGVSTWLWSDNDGLHCSNTPPTGKVPTGHLWGWGPDVKVHLRQDALAPTRGMILVDTRQPGYVGVETIPFGSGDCPKVVHQPRYLKCASPADESRLKNLSLEVVLVVSPTHAVLVGERS